MIRTALVALGLALVLGGQPALGSTVTYSNAATWVSPNGVGAFGVPGHTIGQIFTAPGDVLESFGFLTSSNFGGDVAFGIAQWDVDHPVAPKLYDSGTFMLTAGGFPSTFSWTTFTGMNLP